MKMTKVVCICLIFSGLMAEANRGARGRMQGGAHSSPVREGMTRVDESALLSQGRDYAKSKGQDLPQVETKTLDIASRDRASLKDLAERLGIPEAPQMELIFIPAKVTGTYNRSAILAGEKLYLLTPHSSAASESGSLMRIPGLSGAKADQMFEMEGALFRVVELGFDRFAYKTIDDASAQKETIIKYLNGTLDLPLPRDY